jgi:hypothetical protein
MAPNTQARKISDTISMGSGGTKSHTDDPAAVSQSEGKFFLDVPFEQKDVAKAAGFKWDNTARKWYAATAEVAEAFSASLALEVEPVTKRERQYFQVPFLQKDRAKAIGMRFDGSRKCWYTESEALAMVAGRSFRKSDDS